jgi:hypothetical protein
VSQNDFLGPFEFRSLICVHWNTQRHEVINLSVCWPRPLIVSIGANGSLAHAAPPFSSACRA